MTQARTEIEKLISKGKEENVLANVIYNLMETLHQPYSDIIKMPVPLVFELLRIMEKNNKEMEKEMKKSGRKR